MSEMYYEQKYGKFSVRNLHYMYKQREPKKYDMTNLLNQSHYNICKKDGEKE